MRILVAEDDARLADFLCEELQRAQFAVQKVADGVQAQELASNQNYDLVILDLTLPGVWGLDILGGIRSIKPDLPVLIITGLQNWKSASVGWMLARTTVSRSPSSSPSFPRAFARSCGEAAAPRASFCRSRISRSNASPTLFIVAVTKSRSAPGNIRSLNFSCAMRGWLPDWRELPAQVVPDGLSKGTELP